MTGLFTSLPVSLIVEATLGVLLAATLFFCARLEWRLKALRADQAGLVGTIHALNSAIAAAQASLSGLRHAAKEADDTLGRQIENARTLAEELSLLSAAGERIAGRIEAGRPMTGTPARKPMHATQALRAVR